MPSTVSRKLLIHGFFPGDAFADWISNRAHRLSLGGWVKTYEGRLIEVCIVGDRVLVEAMEVACSLGPADARVDLIDSLDVPESTTRHTGQYDGYSRITSFAIKHVE